MFNYQKLYQDRGLSINLKDLKKIIQESSQKAQKRYELFKEPVITSKKLYTHAFIKNSVLNDIIKYRHLIFPSSEYKHSLSLYLSFPNNIRTKLRKEIYNAPISEREKIWNKYKLNYRKIEKAIIGLTIQRNIWAQRMGFDGWLDKQLNFYKIPKKDYKNLDKNILSLIRYCQKQLNQKDIKLESNFYSEFYTPCYICILNGFPFKNVNEVKTIIFKKFKILKKYRSKIKIKFSSDSKMYYQPYNDDFVVNISRDENFRHQSLLLLHEMFHVVNHIESFQRGILPSDKGAYYQEKNVLNMTMSFLKKNYPDFYPKMFSELLRIFLVAFFELEFYKNPRQDLSKLYAKAFNLCYPGVKQTKNRSYLLEENILDNPLSTLPYAVAQAELISKRLVTGTP